MDLITKKRIVGYKKNYNLKKSLFIMKCFIVFLLMGTLQGFANVSYSQSMKFSMDLKNSTIEEVLSFIEQKSSFYFTYNVEQINSSRRVSVSVKDKTVTEILDQLFAKENIGYSINDTHIVLFKKQVNTSQPNQNGKRISGIVKDNKGEPVIGANIIEKGTSNGVITDLDGRFDLNVDNNAKLIVSYIGYNSQEISVAGKSIVEIILKEDSKALEEVVVVGYGTQKKVNLTGSVASLSADEIKDRVQTNVLSSVQGTVPGVTVISRPGSDPSINFRGRGNLGVSSPLYVIDGAMADANFFANLDPNSIESISFLKDAASSAIYGSRAAYGVVLVTTKQGKEGQIQVSYNGMVGTKMPSFKPELVTSWEYAELFNEAKYNSNPAGGKNQGFTNEEIGWFKDGSKPDLYPNTDWIDLIYDDHAITTQHSFNFTGGTNKLRYFTGLGYVYDTENLRNRNNKRYNLNLNISSDLTDWLTLRSSVKYIQKTREINGGTPSMNNVLIVPCTFVAKQSNGEWGSVDAGNEASGTFAGGNPLRAYDTNNWNQSKRENTMYDLAFDLKPLKGLVITGQGVYKLMESKSKNYNALVDDVPSFLKPGTTIKGTGNTLNSMSMSWESDSWLTYTGTANYSWTNQVHSFSTLAGISYEHYKYEMLGASRENFPADTFTDMSAGAASGANYKNSSNSYEYKMLSYFARFNYTLLDRYMFEANVRADASSRFHKDNRWGYFPSFSAGWRISEEGFMDSQKDWLDNLKIRASYGSLGNINNVGNYDYFANYSSKNSWGSELSYTFDNVPVKVLQESKPANPKLGWEKVTLTDLGVDFDLFNGKLRGTVDYYIKNTSDILLAYNVPVETGITKAPSQNIAKVRNKGFEFALTHQNKIGEISYQISGNISTNSNRIIDLATSDDIIQNLSGHGVGKYILRKGEAIGSFYGFKSDGLYTQADIDAGHYYTYGGTVPNAGDVKFVPQRDLKYGEAITNADRVIIGNDVPKFTYGFNMSIGYKNFELSAFGQGVNGTDVGFEVYQMHPFFHGQDNPRKFHLKRWTEANPNPNAIYPRLYDASSPHTAYNRSFSDYHIFDADYFRIKTLTFGYSIPQSSLSKLGLSAMKLYVTGENLFTFRADNKIEDFDPETAGGVVQALGIKSLAFGVNISF